MTNGPSSAFEIFVSAVYPAWSLLWALLWFKVCVYYGGAAFDTWKSNGATLKSAVSDIFDPILVAFRDFACHWHWGRKLFGISEEDCNKDLIPTASPGNILRFAISLGSLTPISFGLAFAFVDVWRGDFWKITVTMFFMMTSILGALGHLFLANRGRPKKWSKVVVYTFAWIFVGPLLFYLWETM